MVMTVEIPGSFSKGTGVQAVGSFPLLLSHGEYYRLGVWEWACVVLIYPIFTITRVTVVQCRKLGNHRRGQSGGNKHGAIGISATFQPNNIHTLVLCANHLFVFIKTGLA